jgi:DNA-binding SARP family transcriptional activator/tetratricopeptide (TPR) repeat protein
MPFAAARGYARAGDSGSVQRLVETCGERMLREGNARGVVALLSGAPHACGSELVQRTYADALWMAGEPAAALHAFRPLVAACGPRRWPVPLSGRVAAVHYTLGDFPTALETLDRAEPLSGTADVEHVEWMTMRVRTLAMLGRRGEAGQLAVETMAAAEALGDPRALAAAHLAMARVSDGARKDAHHDQARRAAEQSGDAVRLALVLVNQSHLQLASARYADAAATAREAARTAELSCPPGRLVAALHNLGEALTRLGSFDEAAWQLQRSVAVCRRLGPGRTALGLFGLAEIWRQLGHDERARAAYLEAVELGRGSHEPQVLVPALAGFARLHAASDPEQALATALEADRLSTPALRPFALVALGWVQLSRGERSVAAEHARDAVAAARTVEAFDMLADALELWAECADAPADAAAALAEALSIWRAGGAEPAAARVELLLGDLDGADATARSLARDAARRLQRMGIVQVHGRPVGEPRSTRRVRIGVLGGFRVVVDGTPVPFSAWRSRQARTLVKILAARRGRPVPRSEVCELLWPDDDPAKTGHRLSVLLKTVRGVLDPEKAWPPDWYVASDLTGLWLDLGHATVDADQLIRDAAHAAHLLESGEVERAREILTDVDGRYRGDAFEDDPYQEWADTLREEARAAWLGSVRRLVTLHRRAKRAADAHGLLVRLLTADPYDEHAHRLLVQSLVRTGRHGEARRAFDRWTQAMRAIDAPLPDPAVLQAPALTARSPVLTR